METPGKISFEDLAEELLSADQLEAIEQIAESKKHTDSRRGEDKHTVTITIEKGKIHIEGEATLTRKNAIAIISILVAIGAYYAQSVAHGLGEVVRALQASSP